MSQPDMDYIADYFLREMRDNNRKTSAEQERDTEARNLNYVVFLFLLACAGALVLMTDPGKKTPLHKPAKSSAQCLQMTYTASGEVTKSFVECSLKWPRQQE